jgi:hypothetical protein
MEKMNRLGCGGSVKNERSNLGLGQAITVFIGQLQNA